MSPRMSSRDSPAEFRSSLELELKSKLNGEEEEGGAVRARGGGGGGDVDCGRGPVLVDDCLYDT